MVGVPARACSLRLRRHIIYCPSLFCVLTCVSEGRNWDFHYEFSLYCQHPHQRVRLGQALKPNSALRGLLLGCFRNLILYTSFFSFFFYFKERLFAYLPTYLPLSTYPPLLYKPCSHIIIIPIMIDNVK